tara:strand:+ start:867 stop:1916 length:1050 start_codon:yes stop_codon:yes gene_type:complete
MLKLVLAFRNLGLPFSLKVRIQRKHRSANLLVEFLQKINAESGPQIVNNFMFQVRKGQNYVRQFLACRNARREVANLYFLKIESEVRARLVKEENERDVLRQSVLSEIPGIAETQYRFKALKNRNASLQSKTRRMLSEIKERDAKWQAEEMRMHLRNKKPNHELNINSIDEDADGNNSLDGSIDSIDTHNASLFSVGSRYSLNDHKLVGIPPISIKAKKGNVLARFIEADVRVKVVAREVRKMRINYLMSTNGFVKTSVNRVVEEKDAKIILETGKDAMIKLRLISEEQMTVEQVERPHFYLFTGSYGGRTWRSLILAQVLADVEKSKLNQPLLKFRPASNLVRHNCFS